MLITKNSPFTRKENTLDIPISEERYYAYLHSVKRPLIQEAFPDLSPGQREFLLTGITPDEWDSMFGIVEDEDE